MEIAIGLWRHQGTNELGLLERFAEHVGARTYADIYSIETWPTEEMLRRMLVQANRIHVNLDGLIETIEELPRIIELGSHGMNIRPDGRGNITNWEIWRINQDPELVARTVYYLRGKVVIP